MIALDFSLVQGAFTLAIHEQFDAPVVALFGPSGAGKTSVLDAIAGLRRPSGGTIAINGRVLYSSAAQVNLPPHERQALCKPLATRRRPQSSDEIHGGGTLPLGPWSRTPAPRVRVRQEYAVSGDRHRTRA